MNTYSRLTGKRFNQCGVSQEKSYIKLRPELDYPITGLVTRSHLKLIVTNRLPFSDLCN